MKLKFIEKVSEGKFLSKYNLHYETKNKNNKIYEMVSRNKDMNICNINSNDTEAVVIAVFNKDKTKVCISKEFRLAVNQEVYNFPAGMVEKGESVFDAGKRELKEETGLDLIYSIGCLKDSYSDVGLSNAKTQMLICVADGEFGGNNNEFEEIIPNWYTKSDVKEMLKNDIFSERTQLFCYLWANDMMNI